MRLGTTYARWRGYRRSAGIAVIGLTGLGAAGVLLAQQTGDKAAAGAYFDPAKLPFNSKVLRPDIKTDFPDWPKDTATGAAANRLTGPKAGAAIERLRGARSLKPGEAAGLDISKQRSGLYLVGIDYVPKDVTEGLKRFGYTLQPDGTLLDKQREPLVALVTNETYLIEPPAGAKSSDASPLPSLFTRLSDLVVPRAHAANPFPFRCYSFTPWAVYHGGFHRWYDARTWASAYGADGANGCSWASPLTNITYIQTRAAVGWPGDEDHCFNCNSEYSRDVWDVGIFWPAHGVPVTTHTGVWADGSFSFSRSAHLTW